MERRLAAVLAIDMVGYSRLVGEDERGTLAAFRRHRKKIFAPAIARHHGRIIKLTGDGALMEFASVVDSVAFAVGVQLALLEDGEGQADERQYLYRIGINIGDIVPDEGDIYGDGVNLAARMEGVAEPGGVCMSGPAYQQVKGKIDLNFEFIGEKNVKNIAEPVACYHVVMDGKARALASAAPDEEPAAGAKPRLKLAATAIVALLVAAGVAFWWQDLLPVDGTAAVGETKLALPNKPSIAVMPFANVSGDEGNDHLARGLTDDLITELSKVSGMFVIARNSAFSVGEDAGDLSDVARKLGVRYVLEGSLRQAKSRLRVNVKLIEGNTGRSLWAERYDRAYADLFKVQDDVIGQIISSLAVKLTRGEENKLARIPTGNLEAYDNYLRAEQEGFYFVDVETYRRALSFYQQALQLDPEFADAYAGIARIAVDVWRNDYNFLWTTAVARKIAYDAAGQALKLDPDNARAHSVLALLQLVDQRPVEATQSAIRAAQMQPNDPDTLANLALVLVHTGNRARAVRELEKALRLDPEPSPSLRLLAGVVYYVARDHERAIPHLEAALEALPNAEPAPEYLAAAYSHTENLPGAEEAARHLRELFPAANLTYYSYFYDYWNEVDRLHHIAGLRVAGVSEWPFGFEGNEADRLSGDELEKLMKGKTWAGRHENGAAFMQYFDQAGHTAYRSVNATVTGKVEVNGPKLCEKFEGYFLDRLTCGYVYRNGEKSSDAEDYIYATPFAIKYFSVSTQ